MYPPVTLLNTFMSFKRTSQNHQGYWISPRGQTWRNHVLLVPDACSEYKAVSGPKTFINALLKEHFGFQLNSHGLKTFDMYAAHVCLPHFSHHSFLGLDFTLVFEGSFCEWPAMIYCQSIPDMWKGLVKACREKELQFSDKISHESFKLTL